MADLERGARIKARREELHLTQPAVVDMIEELAWKLPADHALHPVTAAGGEGRPKPPVSLRGYQTYERGGGIVWEKAKLLAQVLELDVNEMMKGPAEPNGNLGVRHLDTPELLRMLDSDNGIADRLEALERRVTDQLAEHAARVEQLLLDQDALLARQSQILERIEAAFTSDVDEWVRLSREVIHGRPEAPPERPRAARRTAAAKKS